MTIMARPESNEFACSNAVAPAVRPVRSRSKMAALPRPRTTVLLLVSLLALSANICHGFQPSASSKSNGWKRVVGVRQRNHHCHLLSSRRDQHCHDEKDQEAFNPPTPFSTKQPRAAAGIMSGLAAALCIALSTVAAAALAEEDTVIAASSSSSTPRTTIERTSTVRISSNTQAASTSSVSSSNLLVGKKYWDLMNSNSNNNQENKNDNSNSNNNALSETKRAANKALMDYTLGTVSALYYDNTGGALFQPRDLDQAWRRYYAQHVGEMDTREGLLKAMTWLTNDQLHSDPFSKYLTREELKQELRPGGGDSSTGSSFLGLGAMVEPANANLFFGALRTPVLSEIPPQLMAASSKTTTTNSAAHSFHHPHHHQLMSAKTVSSLPVLTAIVPHSAAERAGLTVGDRIVAVQKDVFLGLTPEASQAKLKDRYHAENYMGAVELTVAKPVYASSRMSGMGSGGDVIVAYRPQHVRLSTSPSLATTSRTEATPSASTEVAGGNNIVQYRLLSSSAFSPAPSLSTSISASSSDPILDINDNDDPFNIKVGYIRLTRFSKASTNGFVEAVEKLEAAHADSYIIDLRNNYGGVIQEALLTASTLLRDPHTVLCYTMNARGGFYPHMVEEYVVNDLDQKSNQHRYPGYLLSSERNAQWVTLQQIKKESPQYFGSQGWTPPSSYASLHEQHVKRGLKRTMPVDNLMYVSSSGKEQQMPPWKMQKQKPIILLVNEGTASSAEVFASSLKDNGRTVAVVGTRTYGKGLIQHTFPLPDGGGLRMTVAEYLTPALHHVTKVGGAQFDPQTGLRVGGGIEPDIVVPTIGIPTNVGGDLCVNVGMNILQEVTPPPSLSSRTARHRLPQAKLRTVDRTMNNKDEATGPFSKNEGTI